MLPDNMPDLNFETLSAPLFDACRSVGAGQIRITLKSGGYDDRVAGLIYVCVDPELAARMVDVLDAVEAARSSNPSLSSADETPSGDGFLSEDNAPVARTYPPPVLFGEDLDD